jgi:hypothetical protein
MGLAERRGIHLFTTEKYPDWQTRIEAAAGFPVPVEVAWEELAVPDYADSYPEFFAKVYFEPLVTALADVTRDELGRTAARAGLKRIVIRNSGEQYGTYGFSFTDGVLTVDHRPDANVDYVDERTKGLVRILENGL